MPSLLSYGDQAFRVSNSAKDLFYEAAIEVARHGYPTAHRRLSEDGRLLGCYLVSGVGFPLEAIADAFGGKQAWQEATARNIGAVEALCSTPQCMQLMRKALAWSWYLLDGGRCHDATAVSPDLHHLPETPDEWTPPLAVESPAPWPDDHWLYRTPSTRFKFAFGIGFGAMVGTLVGVGSILLGLVQNWLTVPAWVFVGALLGSIHPTIDAVLSGNTRTAAPPDEWREPASDPRSSNACR